MQPFQFSPLTMVALEADGVPLQPPHPTIPPYSLRATSMQFREFKFQAEQPRMPMEWHTQSPGTC